MTYGWNAAIRYAVILCLALSCCLSSAFAAKQLEPAGSRTEPSRAYHRPQLDYSGKKHKGKASYYSRKFARKIMADGTRMNPDSNGAASRMLPLGTKARVTNLRNGKSAIVVVRDRGPHIRGRIIDLSPKTAKILGIRKQGVVPVEVAPIEVPQRDGSVKTGMAEMETAAEKNEL